MYSESCDVHLYHNVSKNRFLSPIRNLNFVLLICACIDLYTVILPLSWDLRAMTLHNN